MVHWLLETGRPESRTEGGLFLGSSERTWGLLEILLRIGPAHSRSFTQ